MIATVAFGSWVILVMWGITDGLFSSMTNSQTTQNQGAFQVRAVGYADDPIPSNGLTLEELERAETALGDLRIRAISPRLEAFGILRSAYGTEGVAIRGIDPVQERLVTNLQDVLTEGRYLEGQGEVLLSTWMAESLDVRVGERVVLLTSGDGGTASLASTAVGLFSSTVIELKRVAMIPIDDARSLTGWAGATAIAVSLLPGSSSARTVKRAEALLESEPKLEVADYFTLNPMARLVVQGGTVKMIPFVIMIAVLVGFGVANTTFYSVLERTREFGVMTALGMSRRRLARVILLESVFVSAIGFAIGGSIGYGFLLYMSRVGLDFGNLIGDLGGGFGMPTIIYTSTSGWYWVGAFSVVVFTALAAAWYPARRVNHLEPVTAIREG
jgi:ABC-type lipoprotein release transport system permease subunit